MRSGAANRSPHAFNRLACNCSDLMGSEAIFACSVRSLQHKLSVAERLRPLKREQLRLLKQFDIFDVI